MLNLTAQQLRRAAGIKEKLASLQNELDRILGASAPARVGAGRKRRKNKISAAGRARIAAAQRARWAKLKGSRKGAAKPRRKMSAAARKRLAQMAKARWAKAKAAGKSRL